MALYLITEDMYSKSIEVLKCDANNIELLLIDNLTVSENVALISIGKYSKIQDLENDIKKTCQKIGISHITQKYPQELTVWEKRRVLFARFLFQSNKIYVTEFLNDCTQDEIFTFLSSLEGMKINNEIILVISDDLYECLEKKAEYRKYFKKNREVQKENSQKNKVKQTTKTFFIDKRGFARRNKITKVFYIFLCAIFSNLIVYSIFEYRLPNIKNQESCIVYKVTNENIPITTKHFHQSIYAQPLNKEERNFLAESEGNLVPLIEWYSSTYNPGTWLISSDVNRLNVKKGQEPKTTFKILKENKVISEKMQPGNPEVQGGEFINNSVAIGSYDNKTKIQYFDDKKKQGVVVSEYFLNEMLKITQSDIKNSEMLFNPYIPVSIYETPGYVKTEDHKILETHISFNRLIKEIVLQLPIVGISIDPDYSNENKNYILLPYFYMMNKIKENYLKDSEIENEQIIIQKSQTLEEEKSRLLNIDPGVAVRIDKPYNYDSSYYRLINLEQLGLNTKQKLVDNKFRVESIGLESKKNMIAQEKILQIGICIFIIKSVSLIYIYYSRKKMKLAYKNCGFSEKQIKHFWTFEVLWRMLNIVVCSIIVAFIFNNLFFEKIILVIIVSISDSFQGLLFNIFSSKNNTTM